MNKINNTESINKIVMKPQATCLCQIGQDWYLNNFTVEFYPNDYYPDYMEVEAWINKNIEGRELNIEHAVNLLYNFLNEYSPAALRVTSTVTDCKTHFDVVVSK